MAPYYIGKENVTQKRYVCLLSTDVDCFVDNAGLPAFAGQEGKS